MRLDCARSRGIALGSGLYWRCYGRFPMGYFRPPRCIPFCQLVFLLRGCGGSLHGGDKPEDLSRLCTLILGPFGYAFARFRPFVSVCLWNLRVASRDDGFSYVQRRFPKFKQLGINLHQPRQELGLPLQVGDLHPIFLPRRNQLGSHHSAESLNQRPPVIQVVPQVCTGLPVGAPAPQTPR